MTHRCYSEHLLLFKGILQFMVYGLIWRFLLTLRTAHIPEPILFLPIRSSWTRLLAGKLSAKIHANKIANNIQQLWLGSVLIADG
ncbi:MAG: hypothetical protein IGS54_31140 [Elainella sp. C42_A2020_010]|nr:hypothetical protein [Elainella sp. C42_A2020_010]